VALLVSCSSSQALWQMTRPLYSIRIKALTTYLYFKGNAKTFSWITPLLSLYCGTYLLLLPLLCRPALRTRIGVCIFWKSVRNNLLAPSAEACKSTVYRLSIGLLAVQMYLWPCVNDCAVMQPSAPDSHCTEGMTPKCANLLLYLTTEITNHSEIHTQTIHH
jgi:hypothetical protein